MDAHRRMFSVIRKIQGRKYEPAAPSRNFEANNKHIARVAAKDNVADKDPSVTPALSYPDCVMVSCADCNPGVRP